MYIVFWLIRNFLNIRRKETPLCVTIHSPFRLLCRVMAAMTSFRHGSQHIRFRTSPRLERYTAIKEWDNGYIVVTAKYQGIGEVEEYIDLIPILRNLYIDAESFLKPIKSVEIIYEQE